MITKENNMDIKIGATYTTSNPDIPTIRVICELSRDTDAKGNVIGKCRGYQAQVCDGKYHAPVWVNVDGTFTDIPGALQTLIEQPLPKYRN